jgi:hypothetical protein
MKSQAIIAADYIENKQNKSQAFVVFLMFF